MLYQSLSQQHLVAEVGKVGVKVVAAVVDGHQEAGAEVKAEVAAVGGHQEAEEEAKAVVADGLLEEVEVEVKEVVEDGLQEVAAKVVEVEELLSLS